MLDTFQAMQVSGMSEALVALVQIIVINVVLNRALMRLWGVAGIALSTSLVYLLSAALLAAISVRLLGQERAIAVAQTKPAGQ